MTGTAGPNLGLIFGFDDHDDGWGTSYNTAFEELDAIVHLEVLSAALTAPPGSPTAGDRYIVAASPTGAWSGHAKDVAVYRASAWHFFTPKSGWSAYNRATSTKFRYDSGAWADEGSGGGGSGTPPTLVRAGASVGASSSVTLGGAPSQGNVLLAFCTHWSNNIFASAGWQQLYFANGSSVDGITVAMKVAGAGESATQVPFAASAAGQSTIIWEISGMGGPITLCNVLLESTASSPVLDAFNSTSGLVLGCFSVQSSNYDYTLTGNSGSPDVNVTSTTSSNSPRRIKGFHVDGATGPASVTANLDTNHSTAGVIAFIPGS